MADEEAENKFATVVSDFLLNPDIEDQSSLEEFQALFPAKYSEHNDVKLLHDSLVMKRKMLKEHVKQNIQEFYQVEKPKKRGDKNQVLKDAIAILEIKQQQMYKEVLKAKTELRVLQDNVERCNEAVQNCHLMKTDSKKYFDMDILKKLERLVPKQDKTN